MQGSAQLKGRMHAALRVTASTVVLTALGANVAGANSASRELVNRAFEQAYNLDHDQALALFRQAIAADPQDPAPHRGIAAITWLNILTFERGSVSFDDYLGNITRPNVKVKPPSSENARVFSESVAQALALCEARLAKNPKDADAQYQLGATVGILTSYQAVIEGKVLGAFRAARRAYHAHEQVLRLDPSRADAGLIVGSYRYVISALSLPIRMMAYVAGFGGGRERGLKMIEAASAYPGDSQPDARFLLILIYNRERNFDGAIRVIHDLQKQFPRNRFLWLNEGGTELRAGRAERAERALSEGIARLETDRRPRALGEEALWHYKRGTARARLRNHAGARRDLEKALTGPARDWVRGRTHIELGKLAQAGGDRAGALKHFDEGITLCRRDADRECVEEGTKGKGR
jgi:tetratricopeptide (TPR) repeat protein